MATATAPPAGVLESRELPSALLALPNGDFSVRLPNHWTCVTGNVADAFNEVVAMNATMVAELELISVAVGQEDKVLQRANIDSARGAWSASSASVNELICDFVHPFLETSHVMGAVAKGDLSQTLALEVEDRPLKGEC